jgi:hypothetical protein
LNYRASIRAAIQSWEGGGCFRSKSDQSQSAVNALEELMTSDPLDDRLHELVEWLVGTIIQQPASHPLLRPIKQKCKLRDELNAARRRAGRPNLRTRTPAPERRPQSSMLVLPSQQQARPAVRPSASVRPTITTPLLAPSSASSSAAVMPARVTPQPTPRPTPILISVPVVAPPSAVPVPRGQRHLIIDAARAAPGDVVFTYNQDTVGDFIRGPMSFFGFCNAATGRFLKEPDTIEKYLKSIIGKTALSTAQSAYESVGKADAYITAAQSLSHLGTVGPHLLTPEAVLKCVDAARGPRIALYLVGAPDGGGHAIGIIKDGSAYRFLDVNEGLARLATRTALWQFLFHYINDPHEGIKRDYPQFCMASWA